jgi:hypothetical protein
MPVSGPTVVRRQLGRRLRRLREEAQKTELQVEDAKLVSRTKLWRIESGKTAVKVPDVRALCWFYGVGAELTDALASMAVGTSDQGWWEGYGDVVPDWFRLYVGLESATSLIRYYGDELVPGLLQTEDYARAVYQAAQIHDGEAIERHVALRMERQEALARRDPPPRMMAVLGAGVLSRQVGGSAAMATQIDALQRLNKLDHVEIRVLGWDVGAHAAMVGAFHIMDFPDHEDPDVVYLEAQVGGRYLEKTAEVDEYRRIFDLIYKQAVPIEGYDL